MVLDILKLADKFETITSTAVEEPESEDYEIFTLAYNSLTDDEEEAFLKSAKKEKWIQKGVKHPGRFEGWSLSDMKKRYNALKKKEDKSKAEVSEMRALALGIRFKGGDVPGGKQKKGL